jgi:hypothetical protein
MRLGAAAGKFEGDKRDGHPQTAAVAAEYLKNFRRFMFLLLGSRKSILLDYA